MAMAGESPSASLKLLRLPPESIRAETRVPTEPDGVPESSVIVDSSGLAAVESVGVAASTAMRWPLMNRL